jgi:eukaryotic-like serine/threonine-protein kinase
LGKQKDSYPSIFLSGTDTELPADFANDFSKFSYLSELSGGGSGLLQAFHDKCLGRNVAIKRLKPETIQDPRERRRLLREARITAQLGHPNTVPVYEIGNDDQGNLYFAMKKIEGEDLFKILTRIARQDRVTREIYNLDTLLEIIVQVGNAVAYAHAHGVIHRDLKPENILVGMYGAVYVMDWGIAKVWGMSNESYAEDFSPQSDLYQRLTISGQRPGTPLYMSPEQVLNRHIDERSDIFSMGVVLYELLALREPFRGKNVDETFQKILSHDPSPPSQVATHQKIPKKFDDICAKAFAKKPAERYQSMIEFLQQVRSVRAEAMQSDATQH